MESVVAKVYVMRHEEVPYLSTSQSVLSAINTWARVSGETEDSAPFAGLDTTKLSLAGSAQVYLYPDLEVAGDGEFMFDRKPDAVKTLSPFYVEQYELLVQGTRVPKEASFVVLVGDKVISACDHADFTEVASDAQSGARVFDVETMASEGQDGVYGLLLSAAAAAANVPDTDMWNHATYAEDGIRMIAYYD